MSINWSRLLRTEQKPEYPMTQETPDRIQVQVDTTRYAMALRNQTYGHWCLYVRVNQQQAVWLDARAPARLHINYCAPAGRPITWMTQTRKGKLSVPLLIGPDPDYWAGRILPARDFNHAAVIAALLMFESELYGIFNDDRSVPG